MNTVLIMEVQKYNYLLENMKKNIQTLKLGLTGKIVMSEDMEKMANSLFINQVPILWSGTFLSLKPLSSWIKDLIMRIDFLQKWIDDGTPKIFWISGFSFPQAFLTAALQNFARKNKYAIDLLSFEFRVRDDLKSDQIKEGPEAGIYAFGMFMEGAKWNEQTHFVDDSVPKELYTDVPIIHFLPVLNRVPPTTGFYECPLYKVLSRKGTLSTTGHSTNFVIRVEMPSDRGEDYWIKAGVAMFLALKT